MDPGVDEDGANFVLPDRYHRLAGVRLVQEVGLEDGLEFERGRGEWRLRLPRPEVDRMEYLFEVRDHNDRYSTLTDPANPLRAPGAFGEKSVLLFPGYEPPRWLAADPVDATITALEIDAPELDAAVDVQLWEPVGLTGGAPLVLVHDGPEFAELGGFTHHLGVLVASGLVPPVRAALLGPGDRNVWYAANPAYARTIIDAVLPQLPPTTGCIGVGVSLGALAMLHLQRAHPGALDALLLQSGSFFTPVLDPQESGFSAFDSVTTFVASVHEADNDQHPVPTSVTCGVPEENLANNRAMTGTLQRLGYASALHEVRDAHNYTAWRDALHPHLAGLITTVVDERAA